LQKCFVAILQKKYRGKCLSVAMAQSSYQGKSHKRLKNNYSRLIDFLSHISKLFYFTLLGLPDFFMHH